MFLIRRSRLVIWLCVLVLVFAFGYGITLAVGAKASGSRDNRNISGQAPAWQKRQLEVDARLDDPRWLMLKYVEFDPLENEPPSLKIGAEELQSTSVQELNAKRTQSANAQGYSYFIIQFNDVIKPQDSESLSAAGYEIVGYVPHNAYIVRAAEVLQDKMLAARNSGLYRWVGAYGPALKVEPKLAQTANEIVSGQQSETANSREFIAVSFLTFRGEKIDGVRSTLAALNMDAQTMLEERVDSRIWGVVMTPPQALAQLVTALANVEGVEWI